MKKRLVVMASDEFQNDLSDLSMLELFRMEVETQTGILNQGLLEMEHVKPSPDLLENMMRAAHSIKGAARMVNVQPVVQIAHLMEDCFVAVQGGLRTLNERDIDNLLAGTDLILQIAQESDNKIETWMDKNSNEFQHIENSLRAINNGEDHSTDEEDYNEPESNETDSNDDDEFYDPVQIVPESSLASQTTVRISIDRLDKFLSLAGKSLVETHQFSALMPAYWQLKHKQQLLISEVSRLQESLSEDVETEKLKDMVKNILQDMNALRHQFAENVAALDAIDRRTSTISDHLHREIMSSRMRPISEIIGALPRMVRDLGRRLNKDVRLRMSGLSTLVDRHVLEKIDTPVKHLIQNAIDHGIEYPDEREAVGKPAVASITLSASMSAG
ncbi:MAG: Hpt domain-containing protein, partial [Gammaproteobacteria bacterium]|nr:Hpt domain-containing protein [Gammaproteobacteria bacterium]